MSAPSFSARWTWLRRAGVAAVGAGAVLSACAYLPSGLVGESAFSGIRKRAQLDPEYVKCNQLSTIQVGFEEERTIGGTVAINWAATDKGLWLDPPKSKSGTLPVTARNQVNKYVATVGKNLGEQSTRPLLAWTFAVIESDVPNAFSAPGGYVFVTTALLKQLTSEDELAGVLAHEISHVTLEHALKQYQRIKVAACTKALDDQVAGAALGPASSALGGLMSAATFGVWNLNDASALPALTQLTSALTSALESLPDADEFEADVTGAGLMASAGYSPRAYADFLRRQTGPLIAKHADPRFRAAQVDDWIQKQNDTAADQFHEFPATLPEKAVVALRDELKEVP